MDTDVRQVGALTALLRELGLPVTLLSPVLSHAAAVARDADRLGLVAVGDAAAVVSRHTADSLLFALVREPVPDETWVDVGTGAGFPGMVLACCYAGTTFSLIEPQRRRAGFLEAQRARLGLDNVDVVIARSEDVPGPFDVAVARALADPLVALHSLRRLAPDGDVIVAVGDRAVAPLGVEEFRLARRGVDSPGRLFMMPAPGGGAA